MCNHNVYKAADLGRCVVTEQCPLSQSSLLTTFFQNRQSYDTGFIRRCVLLSCRADGFVDMQARWLIWFHPERFFSFLLA